MKKLLSIVCVVSLAASMLSGCGKKEPVNVDGEKITLRFSFWEPSTGKEMETVLEEIASSYEEKHQNVDIQLVSQASSGYQDWIKTQMSVDDLPEIELNGAGRLINQYKAGSVISLKEYLDAPNPYNSKKIWRETFVDGSMDAAHEYRIEPDINIPLFGTGIAMFYNKDMYKELGLKIPNNWDEYLENCKVIADAGKIPDAFMGQKNDAVSWLGWELVGGLCLERWLKDPMVNVNGDSYISINEIVRAIDSGDYDISKDKDYQNDFKEIIKYVKEYMQYAPNASGLDEAAAKTLFLSGQAAHITSGSWDIVGLTKNDEVNFEVGIFNYPHLTKENSQYAGKGISNNCYQTLAVTSSVEKQEGAKEAAVDFLMYLTSPQQYSKFVTATIQIPSVKDVKVDSLFETFREDGYPLTNFFRIGNDAAGRSYVDIIKEVISGKDVQLDDKLFAEIQKSIKAYSDEKKESEKWTPENNYNIDTIPFVGEAVSQ